MSMWDQRGAGCRQMAELDLRVASGEETTADERAFMEQHRAECEPCNAVAEALAVVRHGSDAGGAVVTDELTARRVIDAALAEAAKPSAANADRGTDRPPAPAARQRAPQRRVLYAALGGATALVAVALVMLFGGGLFERDVSLRPTTAARGASNRAPTVVLSAGDVRSVRGALAVGERLSPGEVAQAAAGRLAFRVGPAVTVLLHPQTVVRVPQQIEGQPALDLVRGEVTVSVRPGAGGPGFAVQLGRARVVVTGTLFSVRRRASADRVAVLRGAVRVTTAAGTRRELRSGNGLALPKGHVQRLGAAERRALQNSAKLLYLLGAERTALLSLSTDPAGASVDVDGMHLGVTPLDVRLASGFRDVVVELAEHAPVRERMEMLGGQRYARDYQLSRRRKVGPGRGGDQGHGVAPSGSSLRALVDRARRRRAQRDWAGAARAYQALITGYPQTGAARTALVSLGTVQLEHLKQYRAALRSFRRYLATSPSGVLAPEAHWGLVRTFRALGRRTEERAAIKRFLRQYPRSVNQKQAKQRLRALRP